MMTPIAPPPQPALATSLPRTERPAPPARTAVRTFTEVPAPGESVEAMFRRLARKLAEHEAVPLGAFIFGPVDAEPAVLAAMEAALGALAWPVTWIEGRGCRGAALAGVQLLAASGGGVERIRVGRRVVGSVFEDGSARHCLLGGLEPVALSLAPAAQVQQMFGNLELALERGGFGLGDVVRTWFYNDDILAWYPEFNRVRTAHYAGVRWRTGSLPASTGIGARNPAGAAVELAVWAARPLAAGAAACAREIASPLQCPAPSYGSGFSRAMEVDCGGRRRLFVSGTASIHPDGRTAWVGDARRQVDLTMEVVAAILQSRGLGFGDVTRATAYLRHAADLRHFDAWLAERDLRSLPVVPTQTVICRDDLLFEIEVDAVGGLRDSS